MTDIDHCPYCAHPLKPIYDEHGDLVLWHGYELTRCKTGHEFVGLPYQREETEVTHTEAKAA
jgi:hypothetical protein